MLQVRADIFAQLYAWLTLEGRCDSCVFLMSTAPQIGSGQSGLEIDHDSREIGHLAVWTVTSAKPGNGVELLRDGSDDTYWQSDGTQPHLVDMQFQKKIHIQVCRMPCYAYSLLDQG